MSFKPYPKYKESEVEWLGRVPEHWEVKPLKYIARFTSGGTPSKTNEAYWGGDVPWASSKDLKSETLEDTADHITQVALDEDAACLIPTGTVLVVVRGMILLHTFPVVQTLVPMAINQDLKALTPTPDVHPAYLPWLLRGSTTETFGRIDEAAHGTKVLRMESWTSIELPIPSIAEQLRLAAFLGHETAKIDALIAEQQRLIELLQEKRQSVISHAVTKGLDPNAPQKDSGLEWPASTPEHYTVLRIGQVIELQRGADITKDNQDQSGQVPVVSSGGVSSFHDTALVDGPGVVVGRKGTAGAVHWIESDYWPHDTTLYVRDFGTACRRFVYYRLLAMDLPSLDTGSANPTLNRNRVHPIRIPCPPFGEQVVIAAFLDQETSRFDSLVAESVRAVSLLQERRSALISAAVTGQIDVRGFTGKEHAA